jgi:BT1 family
MDEEKLWSVRYFKAQLERALLNPIRAFRIAYIPLLMVYFSYGALGLTNIVETFWIKQKLSLTATELASLGVWLTLPWTIKMVFGELVDSVAIFGSQRRVYIFIGGGLLTAGLLILAGAAGGWITLATPETPYRIASFLIVVGVVIRPER